jgi:hypothetical protein
MSSNQLPTSQQQGQGQESVEEIPVRIGAGPGGEGGLPSRESLAEMTAEAEARPLGYNAAARSLNVKQTVDHMLRWKAEGKTPQEIEAMIPTFVQEYPTLFHKVMEPGVDMNMLKSMLALLDRMGQGGMSQHQASIIVGQRLAEKFIRPITGTDGVAEAPVAAPQTTLRTTRGRQNRR